MEIGEKLANKLGIAHGDTVKVSSNRGYIKAKAVVTKRIRTLKVDGQEKSIPSAFLFTGAMRAWRKKGFIANTLTPFVGDANTQTPEFKAFPVNVERCNGDDLWLTNRKKLFVVPRLTKHSRASGAGPPAGGGEACRRHHLYRLQSLSGGLLRMERYS